MTSKVFQLEGLGFLNAWDPAQVTDFRSPAEHERGRTPAKARWAKRLPFNLRCLALSPDACLLVIGTESNAVLVLAGPSAK